LSMKGRCKGTPRPVNLARSRRTNTYVPCRDRCCNNSLGSLLRRELVQCMGVHVSASNRFARCSH
jgi:hypothetical protein